MLSRQQDEVLQETLINFRFRDIIISGYAGTGKTTILVELRKKIFEEQKKLSVAFLAFTGKAASVLNTKLEKQECKYKNDFVGTIHSLIYKALTRWDKDLKTYVVCGWELKNYDEMPYDVFIIDEASMISKEIWEDLKSFNKPIIAAGDNFQLLPIGDKFNLLLNPDFSLTEIHRQALQSPIIGLSNFIRNNGYIPRNTMFSNEVFSLPWKSNLCQNIWNNKIMFDDDNMILLCAFNTTRNSLNSTIRNKLGFENVIPYPGEKVVCLVNNHFIKIMNGQTGKILWYMPTDYSDIYRFTIEINGEIYESLVSMKCFNQVTYTMYDKDERKKHLKIAKQYSFDAVDYFDYGYCISVHKSQGSEWDKVIVFEQRTNRWDDEYYARWLYTAVTRSKEKLFIISDYWE